MVFTGFLSPNSALAGGSNAGSEKGRGRRRSDASGASAGSSRAGSLLRPGMPSKRAVSYNCSSTAASSSGSLAVPTLNVPAETSEGDDEASGTDDGAAQSNSNKNNKTTTASTVPPEYILDEAQIPPVPLDEPDLRELNAALEALAAVFPDVRVEVFREMLANFDGESRLHVAADALLKNRATWVKGRWRIPPPDDGDGATTGVGHHAVAAAEDPAPPGRSFTPAREPTRQLGADDLPLVPREEVFRSDEYKRAVKALAWQEFKGLSRSAINGVLAESNYSYLAARATLVDLSAKSWRFAISSIFLRRKSPIPLPHPSQLPSPSAASAKSTAVAAAASENHPLVVWKSSGRGSLIPSLRSTGNSELDRELFSALVAPLRKRDRLATEARDRAVARALNGAEADEADAALECGCCFTTGPFEEFTACTGGVDGEQAAAGDGRHESHLVCFRCVQHCVTEAVFGQGWRRYVEPETGTLRCPAVADTDMSSSSSTDGCPGRIPADLVQRAMLEEHKGAEIMHRLDQRLAEHSLLASGLPLVRCPFCAYAEVDDDLYVPDGRIPLRLRVDGLFPVGLLVIGIALLVLSVPLLLATALAAIAGLLLDHGRSRTDNRKSAADDYDYIDHTAADKNGHQRGSRRHSHRRTLVGALAHEWNGALSRFRRKRRGLKFRCRNPSCARPSCMACSRPWRDVHVCRETALVALRTQVEQAMSMAIKRVCPRCSTSFVKNAGCNKLTCPCGYKMCYVCRKNIGGADGEGYRHFCDHFRPEGDPRPCTQCRKCNLWESEDEDAVLKLAKEDAERRWLETEKRELSGAEKAFLATGVPARSSRHSETLEKVRLMGRSPTRQEMFDIVVETIFV